MNKIKILFLSTMIMLGIVGFVNINGIQGYAQKKDPKIGLEVGDKAPELMYDNPDGKPVKLSSLQGKMVLIDFWASWCRPCRNENPNVVKAYNEYKNMKFKDGKGFTIYSVSLDKDKDSWVKAIKDDKLEWDTHVSDLQQWKSAGAAIYGVRSIPSNVLIDGNGIILAKNLRGQELLITLESLLAKRR